MVFKLKLLISRLIKIYFDITIWVVEDWLVGKLYLVWNGNWGLGESFVGGECLGGVAGVGIGYEMSTRQAV